MTLALVVASLGLLGTDLWSWDDTLPMGDGIGSVIDGKKVAAFERGHYVLRETVDVPATDAKVELKRPRRFEMGELTIQASAYGSGKVIGLVMPKTLSLAPCTSLETCGVPASAWPDRADDGTSIRFKGKTGPAYVVPTPIPEGPDLRVLDDRAPFPVLATFRSDGRIVVFSGEVDLAPDVLVPQAKDRVMLLDRREGTVTAVKGDRITVDLDAGERTEPLPNPDGHVVPLWSVLLGALAIVGGGVAWRFRS